MYFSVSTCLLLTLSVTSGLPHESRDQHSANHHHDPSSHHDPHAPCPVSDLYCYYEHPDVFYKCTEGIYFEYKCPSGLHFSAKDQICDWPENSDCNHDHYNHYDNYDYDHHYHDNEHDEDHYDGDHDDEHDYYHHDHHDYGSHHASTWLDSEDTDAWWRPHHMTSDQWRDVSSVQLPDHVEHTPREEAPQVDTDSKHRTHKEHTEYREHSSMLPWDGSECDPDVCSLPDCFCPSTSAPNSLPASHIPQMVMLTFDDEVSQRYQPFYNQLFRHGRNNPNGCPIRGCLFVAGSGTVYDLVKPWYNRGLEIASHTVSHRFPATWWSNASYHEYIEEASGMRDNLVSQSGIPHDDITGFRVPFLQLGADEMFSALYDSGFTYDSSMFANSPSGPVWPFTLDYVVGGDFCQSGPCPHKQYPGLWEIPVQRWYGLDGDACAQPDGCSESSDADETFEYLKSNFRRHYNSNRAPLGVFLHARWFLTQHNLDGLDRFIDFLGELDDVYLVTPTQVIDWMKRPTTLEDIHDFEPWSCH